MEGMGLDLKENIEKSDALIDWMEFYAVSAIFPPYYGG